MAKAAKWIIYGLAAFGGLVLVWWAAIAILWYFIPIC